MAEQRLRDQIAEILRRREKEVVAAIRANENPDLSQLEAELRQVIEQELSAGVTAEMGRQSATIGVEYDPTAINQAANEWAKRYSYDLVRGITERTRAIVREAITRFTEAQGMTIGQVKELLEPAFGVVRADAISVTEVTRAYSQGQRIYQEMLRRDGVLMERVWHTDRDDLVCPICRPLNGKPEGEWGGKEPPAHVNCRCSVGLRLKRQ